MTDILSIDPAHQRKKVGDALVKWGLKKADELGLPAFLEATEAGNALYERHGLKECGRVIGDFSKWGGPKEHVNYLMSRDAKA